jgi:hypothetical protein
VSDCLTADCRRAAEVCDECVRALALQWWGAISRHSEAGDGCVLCARGLATWCAACALSGEHGVIARRQGLREGGVQIGEPAALLGLTDHGIVELNWRRFEELVNAEKRLAALERAKGPAAS